MKASTSVSLVAVFGLAAGAAAAHHSFSAEFDSEKPIELQGIVVEVLAGGNYKVKISDQHEVLARLNGKMRQYRIRETARVSVRRNYGAVLAASARVATTRLRMVTPDPARIRVVKP